MISDHEKSNPVRGGCMWSIFSMNVLLIGFAAVSFTQGPYSSSQQKLWYRYGSLGFLLVAVIIPATALLMGARRWRWATALLTVWMLAAFVGFLVYAWGSSGGV